jgi:predicted DNA-binding protein
MKENTSFDWNLRGTQLLAEDGYCAHTWLDKIKVPKEDEKGTLSLVGRIALYGKMNDPYQSQPASQQPEQGAGDQEWKEKAWDKAVKVLELHDQFLKAFPDHDDKDDNELKTCIAAGLIDFAAPLQSRLSSLEQEVKELQSDKKQQETNEYYLRTSWDKTIQERDDLKMENKALSAIKKGLESSVKELHSKLSSHTKQLREAKEENERLRTPDIDPPSQSEIEGKFM